MQSIGDLARTLTLQTYQAKLKSDVSRYGQEVTTGVTADAAEKLNGNISQLAAVQADLTLLGTFRRNAAEAGVIADAQQRALGDIQDVTQTLSGEFLRVDVTNAPDARDALSSAARQALATVVDRLNVHQAGRSLFAGVASDSAAVVDDTTLMNDLRALLAGSVSASDVSTRLDTWFDTAGGGFETSTYLGASSSVGPYALNAAEDVTLALRADDPVLRDTLKHAAMAALATDPSLGFTATTQATLLRQAGDGLVAGQGALTNLRASLGASQARIADATTRNETEYTALTSNLADILGVDGYEAATRLEETQTQLETLYAVTARSSRLRLVDFLR